MNNSPESIPSGSNQLPVKQERATQIIDLNEQRVKRNHKGNGKAADPEVLRPAIENALQEEEQNVALNELDEKQKEESLARKQAVEARLNEIRPNGIILNANDSEEYAELQKELHSLDERLDEHKKPEAKKEQQPEKNIEAFREIDDALYIDLQIFEKGATDENGTPRTWSKFETKNAIRSMTGRLNQKLDLFTEANDEEGAASVQRNIVALNDILSKIDENETTTEVFNKIKEVAGEGITPSERVAGLLNENAYVRKWDKERPEGTDDAQNDKELPSQYEAALTRHGKESETEATPEKTPEERITALETENKELKEKIDTLLAKTNENLEANGGTPETRAKKLGVGSFEQIVSAIGEKWSKFPSKYKYAVSAALIIGGTATAMTGAPLLASAFAGTAVGLRALGGASMYFGIKKFLNTYQEGKLKSDEKLDPHREDLNKITAAAVALTLAVALPGFLQQEFQNAEAHISNFLNPEEALAVETPETAIDLPAEVAAETQTTLVPTEKIAELATVKPGQGFWQPIYNQLAEANPEWSKAELNAETHKLLLQNNIINPDGTELRVQPGEQIVLNKDNTIAFNKEGTYSFKEPVIEAPIAEPQVEQSIAAIEQTVPQIVIDEAALSRNTDMYVRNYVNEMFGGKGFFGFGATSPDAIDKIKDWGGHFGFSNHTISEIVNHEEGPMMVESNNRYGINNPIALEKMQQAIAQVAQETGVQPIPSEKSEEYFRRAVFTSLKNSALKGQ